MTTITLTPEQGQTIEQAGGQPVRVEDPREPLHLRLAQGGCVSDRLRLSAKTELRSDSSISRRAFAARRLRSFAISPSC